ncbi:hypothetical protein N8I74_09665 [Chitiniphilus purpureus]|uniref:Uncharacterized protein n=1 Tax=Chitiniphilus purpureus TaxID=2981137 RepID=A0ABY6DSQ0_9NEIS|nr:hypothetical protein [Chitiniphilus sp. CD1]UXY17253.1 hypothetical protein N8I74_09665 [Chitiniphilus sp. CD1]
MASSDKAPEKKSTLSAATPAFVPRPKPYQREFLTSAQLSTGRGRSYSTGIYDPVSDTRTNRHHFHFDDLRRDSGRPIPKPNALGAPGAPSGDSGTVTYFQPITTPDRGGKP